MLTQTPTAVRSSDAYDLVPLNDAPVAPPPRVIFSAPRSEVAVQAATPQSSAFTGAALIIGLGALLFYLSNDRSFLLGQFVAVVCTPLALYGLVKGGVRKAMMLAAMFAAFYGLATLPDILETILTPMLGATAPLPALVGTAIAGFVLVIVAGVWSKRIKARLHKSSGGIFFDRSFGAMVGMAEGLLVVLTVCWVSTMLKPQAVRLRDQGNAPIDSFRHQFAGNLIRVSDEASVGPIGDFVRSTNPIEQSPALKSMIQSLNETGKFSLEGIDPKLVESVQKMLQGNGANGAPDLNALMNQFHNRSNGGR
ncbi:MAG: CvpA family protein [Planctomycetes bacterium]|nr:CvpA family protein [Planctomycetota bacterium]